MSSLGNFQLYWSSEGSTDSLADISEPAERVSQQYVFASKVDLEGKLRRVRTVKDFLQVVSDSRAAAGDKVAVAGVALLVGNLVATGQFWALLAFAAATALIAFLELKSIASWVFVASTWLLARSIWSGLISLHWVATEALIVMFALAISLLVHWLVEEDPRDYVLIRESTARQTTIRNDCCMDVKLLVFDGSDSVCLVPKGGLLGGVLIGRGASHCVGQDPPYVIKAYAPWENELGHYLVEGGTYSLRATVAPLSLSPAKSPAFKNRSDKPVLICACSLDCWTNSLWLPFAQCFARLVWPARRVEPAGSAPLNEPCTLRVYDVGLFGSLVQRACCTIRPNESAEFLGCIRWTGTSSRSVRRSCSSMFNAIH